MSQAIALAESRLLKPAGLSIGDIEKTFSTLLASGADFGDLYFQHGRRESWSMEDLSLIHI